MKQKIIYSCQNCNHQSIKWLGCCPECNEWNTFREETPSYTAIGKKATLHSPPKATLSPLSDIDSMPKKRMLTYIHEWDRVMGGGIMPSSLLILTGDPGIGKSTLLLHIAHKLSQNYLVYYFSTEESLQQVKLRAQRLACTEGNLLFSDQANLSTIISTAQQDHPDILIIDSLQNCYISEANSLPGSIAQLKEATFNLMRLAKDNLITIILTGHITKDGTIAGPRTLEHMVDGVFYLQGEDRLDTRILRSVKNRFGTINELGFFHMNQHGLEEVPNINAYLLNDVSHSPGSVLISVLEGSRPLLLELQALTIESKLGIAQRVVSGIDHKQVVLIAAILEKYLHIKLSSHDIFLKISGGFKIKGSAVDLGIALALLSSYFQQPLSQQSVALGEISLTGQIKPINHINLFAKEAQKFGIKQLLTAKNQPLENCGLTVHKFSNVYELLSLFSA
jgi:DNA repair protein RadA/Sms